MAVQQFTAHVSEVTLLTEKFWLGKLELETPNRLEFKAGQYLLLDIPGFPQKKSYSIASDPAMTHAVELLVDTSPQGIGTQYITKLKPGDAVKFFAPAGEFTLPDKSSPIGAAETELVFVATGAGIAPLRSMYIDLLRNQADSRRITLFWGLRHEADICWLSELQELADTQPNFQFHIVLSQASPEWNMARGHVTEHVLAACSTQAGYFLCGNQKMVEEMVAELTKSGVAAEHIHREKFY